MLASMRWRIRTAAALLLASSAWAQAPAGWNDLGSEFQDGLLEPWRLAPMDAPPLPAAEDDVSDELVESWIDALADTDRPGPGYSPYSSATQFLPWPQVRRMSATLLPVSPLEANDALRSLEELGPRALPHLLAHLDDPRPTRLYFDSEDRYSTQRLDRRVHGNPLNEREAEGLGEWIFERWVWTRPGRDSSEADYELRVGDLCFVALGQIVNRPHYAAVRYQPSGHTHITSPVEDPELADMLRVAWGGDEPRRMLWDSLLLDFRTRGQDARTLEVGAATRLAYYFPDAAAPLLVRRLDGHHAGRRWSEAEFQDGLVSDELLNALGHCEHPLVAAAWRRALARGWEFPTLASRLVTTLPPEVNEGAWLWERFVQEWERGELEQAYELLNASFLFGPDYAAPMVIEALAHPEPTRLARTCRLLAQAPGDRRYAIESLEGLLGDRRPGGSSYVTESEGWQSEQLCVKWSSLTMRSPSSEPRSSRRVDSETERLLWNEIDVPDPAFSARRLPLRVCDEAAIALACIEDRELDLHTDHAGLEAQVRAWGLGR